jgi:hypothetical protein
MTPRTQDDDLVLDQTADRRHAEPPSLSKSLGLALAVVSIAGSVFVAGYNWRSVTVVEANQDQFVRKDVQQQQLQNINDRLSEVSKQLEQIRGELEKERRRP